MNNKTASYSFPNKHQTLLQPLLRQKKKALHQNTA